MHDVIEDTPFDEEFLRQQGIDDAILEILRFLTHDKETITYENYISHICTNVDAMLVKLADLTDNLDQGTLPVLTERDIERFKTYKTAQQTIMETLAKEHPSIFQEILFRERFL